MRQGLASANADTVRRAAHSLKSNSSSLGALGLSELARQLEADAKAGQLENAAGQIEAVYRTYSQAARALKDWQDNAA
jgi:HPt (histidine-containing phosphotransfer) domain-containing protein